MVSALVSAKIVSWSMIDHSVAIRLAAQPGSGRVSPLCKSANKSGNRMTDLLEHFAISAARALEHVKRVIASIDDFDCGCSTEDFNHRSHSLKVRELVSGALNEQHRLINLGEMIGTIYRRLSCRMQWKSEKHQPSYPFERLQCLSLRCHSSAKRLASGEKRFAWT
jgi:hypothetical protein